MSDNEQYKDSPLVRAYKKVTKNGNRYLWTVSRFIKCPHCENKFEMHTSLYPKRENDQGTHNYAGLFSEVKLQQPRDQDNYANQGAPQQTINPQGQVQQPTLTEDDIPF